jgi:hypothetical protein
MEAGDMYGINAPTFAKATVGKKSPPSLKLRRAKPEDTRFKRTNTSELCMTACYILLFNHLVNPNIIYHKRCGEDCIIHTLRTAPVAANRKVQQQVKPLVKRP